MLVGFNLKYFHCLQASKIILQNSINFKTQKGSENIYVHAATFLRRTSNQQSDWWNLRLQLVNFDQANSGSQNEIHLWTAIRYIQTIGGQFVVNTDNNILKDSICLTPG